MRLNQKIGNGQLAHIRMKPDWIRNGKFRMRMSTGKFIKSVVN
jgi:hypothetical protein